VDTSHMATAAQSRRVVAGGNRTQAPARLHNTSCERGTMSLDSMQMDATSTLTCRGHLLNSSREFDADPTAMGPQVRRECEG